MSSDRETFEVRQRESSSGELLPQELPLTDAEGFRGTKRFALLRRLGSGTFGIVFEAFDKERQERVALKFLRRVSANTLYRFKQEFRALSGLLHPNLVSLYELISDEDQWFFTMEIIEGESLNNDIQGQAAYQTTMGEGSLGDPLVKESLSVDPAHHFDEEKLRAIFRQLAEGLSALHSSGKLHRDIKPPNTMLDKDGRVVLLDFGLVIERDPLEQEQESFVVGTALYMSPEQAAAQPLTAASDWYSVGVMLFQALTGRLPFSGGLREILLEKQITAPPKVRSFAPHAPEDLASLADALLATNPEARPRESAILAVLDATEQRAFVASSPNIVGRGTQLAALREALERVKSGKAITAFVSGLPGMGKSTLLRHFLSSASNEGAIVLQGRCYERESVPYKAFDSIVDALSRRGTALIESLSVAERQALAKIFPVMSHIKSSASEPLEPLEARQLAFATLRKLLLDLSRQGTLIVAVDDLQWGDPDSAALLEAILRPPTPPLMLLGGYRAGSESPLLRLLLERRWLGVERLTLEVGPLSFEYGESLARQLLGGEDSLASEISKESRGNPYFIEELAGAYQAGLRSAPTLEQALLGRISALPTKARSLLEVIAVAGRPVALGVAWGAASLVGWGREELSMLHTARLIEAHGGRPSDKVECLHDRIRETLVGSLTEESQRKIHQRLSDTLLAKGGEPEALVTHLIGANDTKKAREYAALAARDAEEKLAFEQAARLYRLALSLASDPKEDALLRERLAESLCNAGHSYASAQLYHQLAKEQPERASEWEELAAREYLKSGHIDEGVVLLKRLLEEAKIPMAKSSRGALFATLKGRAALWLRGLKFKERAESEVPKELLRKIDLCWTVFAALGGADNTHGADFQNRHMRLALEAGEPYRICRALGGEAIYLAIAGVSKRQQAMELLQQAEQLANRLQNHLAIGSVIGERGNVHMLLGDWREAYEKNNAAENYIREHCGGRRFEASAAQVRALWSMCYLGKLRELGPRVSFAISEAETRGDLYSATSLRAAQAAVIPLLAQGEVSEAQEALRAAMKRWSPQGFHIQHYNDLIAQGEIELYQGKGEDCLARVQKSWPALSGSLLLYIQVGRIESYQLKARAALAASEGKSAPRELLRLADEGAQKLLKEKTAWGDALAKLILGTIEAKKGTAAAPKLLKEAIAGFDATDMAHYAAAAKMRLGALLQADEGQDLRAAAESFFLEQQVKDPQRLTAMLAPGF